MHDMTAIIGLQTSYQEVTGKCNVSVTNFRQYHGYTHTIARTCTRTRDGSILVATAMGLDMGTRFSYPYPYPRRVYTHRAREKLRVQVERAQFVRTQTLLSVYSRVLKPTQMLVGYPCENPCTIPITMSRTRSHGLW